MKSSLQILNEEIAKILSGEQPTNYDFRNLGKQAEKKASAPVEKKKGFFERLFNKNKDNKPSEAVEKKETTENLNKKPRKGFGKFKDTVALFDMFYNSFI